PRSRGGTAARCAARTLRAHRRGDRAQRGGAIEAIDGGVPEGWPRDIDDDQQESAMDDDVLNMSVRKFLKKVGVTSQREIEQAVRDAVAQGKVKPGEKLAIRAEVTLRGIGLDVEIEGELEAG